MVGITRTLQIDKFWGKKISVKSYSQDFCHLMQVNNRRVSTLVKFRPVCLDKRLRVRAISAKQDFRAAVSRQCIKFCYVVDANACQDCRITRLGSIAYEWGQIYCRLRPYCKNRVRSYIRYTFL